ncbi:hypothetical protein, partial [Bradyrhizobium sp.]|uniref:hypothetical protein n=1 Tax=Bradyrhizobium sp. TaxID=376 RepID=UPI0028FE0731
KAIAYDQSEFLAKTISTSSCPGSVPGIHVVLSMPDDVDGRDKPGHDDVETDQRNISISNAIALLTRGGGTATSTGTSRTAVWHMHRRDACRP